MNRFVCVRNIDECFPTAEVFSLKYPQVRYSTAKYSTHTHTHARVLIYKPSTHQKRVRRLHYIRTLHMYKVGTQALAPSLSLPRQPPPPPFQSAIGLGHAPPILNGKHMLNARARLCVLNARACARTVHTCSLMQRKRGDTFQCAKQRAVVVSSVTVVLLADVALCGCLECTWCAGIW